jgi:hypothetical protein
MCFVSLYARAAGRVAQKKEVKNEGGMILFGTHVVRGKLFFAEILDTDFTDYADMHGSDDSCCNFGPIFYNRRRLYG